MDEQPIPPLSQTKTLLVFFSKYKRVFIIVSTFVIVVTIVLTVIMIYGKYINTIKAPSQFSNTQVIHPRIEGLKSDPKYNTLNFTGKVKTKNENLLVLVAGTQTIKVELNNKSQIRLINQAEFSKNPKLFFAKPPEYIQLSEIGIGDNINAFGYGNTELLKALSIIVIK